MFLLLTVVNAVGDIKTISDISEERCIYILALTGYGTGARSIYMPFTDYT